MPNFPRVYSPRLGQYNLASSGKQWQYGLCLPDDAPFQSLWITDCIEEDKWDRRGPSGSELKDPWEMANLLEANLKLYLFRSGLAEDLAAIKWLHDNEPRLRPLWDAELLRQATEAYDLASRNLMRARERLAESESVFKNTPTSVGT